jgi:hypothetical protein
VGLRPLPKWRFRVHTYHVAIPVPTILMFNPPGRLQFMVYLWPWLDLEDDEPRQRRPMGWRRGEWPAHWRDEIKLADGSMKRVFPAPIFYWLSIGPLHVRYFRHRPAA